ncbi:sugar transporter SWEET1 [Leptopilina boulardi]|uniref:sugar transporter SWEET1 n=1 Tax=Leptopilina boulardi TaxID=63433 RepID=UPI0021F5B83C|nr:sugar transporter SWEET1 [Leptopilina boulardi]
MALEDYKDIVGTSAAISTVGQMLAGVLICKDIYKRKSSQNIDPMPFIGGMGMSVLVLQYALILKDFAMINVNVVGFILNVLYTSFYYSYCPTKSKLLSTLAKTAALVAIFIGYAQMEDESKIEFRFGIIVTIVMFLLLASPLIHLGEIFKTKSTEMLSFPIIFMATIVTFQWLLYGLIIDNSFIVFQNAVGFTLSASELLLFVIFPSTPAKIASSKDIKKDN